MNRFKNFECGSDPRTAPNHARLPPKPVKSQPKKYNSFPEETSECQWFTKLPDGYCCGLAPSCKRRCRNSVGRYSSTDLEFCWIHKGQPVHSDMLLKVSKDADGKNLPTFFSPEDTFNPTVAKFTNPKEWMRQVEEELRRLVDVDGRRRREQEAKDEPAKEARREARNARARWRQDQREQQRRNAENEKQHSTQEEADERWRREQKEQRKQKDEGQKQDGAGKDRQSHTNNGEHRSQADVVEKARVLSCWDAYRTGWTEVQQAAPNSLSFSAIPWPITTGQGIRVVSRLTKQAISSFILSPYHSVDMPPKKRLRQALLLYHPDRFMTKVLPRVRVSEQEKVQEAQRIVVLILNDLLEAQS